MGGARTQLGQCLGRMGHDWVTEYGKHARRNFERPAWTQLGQSLESDWTEWGMTGWRACQQARKPTSQPAGLRAKTANPYTLTHSTLAPRTPAILDLCPAPLHRPVSWYPCTAAPLHPNKTCALTAAISQTCASAAHTDMCPRTQHPSITLAPRPPGPLHIATLRAYAYTSTHPCTHLHCNTLRRYAANLPK